MKAFVIKNKEGKYRIPETFDDYEMALCCCPSDCEVVEIEIEETKEKHFIRDITVEQLREENKELKEQVAEQTDYKDEYYHYWQETKKELAQFTDYLDRLGFNNFNDFEEWMGTFMLTPHEEQTLIKELKEQVANKDQEIKKHIDALEYWENNIPNQRQAIRKQVCDEIKEKFNNENYLLYGDNNKIISIHEDKFNEILDQIEQAKESIENE